MKVVTRGLRILTAGSWINTQTNLFKPQLRIFDRPDDLLELDGFRVVILRGVSSGPGR